MTAGINQRRGLPGERENKHVRFRCHGLLLIAMHIGPRNHQIALFPRSTGCPRDCGFLLRPLTISTCDHSDRLQSGNDGAYSPFVKRAVSGSPLDPRIRFSFQSVHSAFTLIGWIAPIILAF